MKASKLIEKLSGLPENTEVTLCDWRGVEFEILSVYPVNVEGEQFVVIDFEEAE